MMSNAISHINGATLLAILKATTDIMGQAEIRSIHQHPDDLMLLCVDIEITGRGLFAAIVQYDPSTWIPVDVSVFESVTDPCVFC